MRQKHKFIFTFTKKVKEDLSFEEFASLILLRVVGVKFSKELAKNTYEEKKPILNDKLVEKYKKEINKSIKYQDFENEVLVFSFEIEV